MPRRVGPIDPDNGFPIWYADENDTVLELALATDDPNLPGLEVPPGTEVVFPTNFPDEAFYSLVESEMIVDVPGGTTRARLILALEAAFGGTGDVVDGQQMVFGRVRFRMDGAAPGDEYTVTHPYGSFIEKADEDEGDVDRTEDIGAPQDFTAVLQATPWPFVRATNAPAGYIGDGATATTITGVANPVFAIEGPGVSASGRNRDPADPANPNRALTRLFTVRGKEATRFGVDVRRASWISAGGGVHIDVVATSRPGQQIEVTGNGVQPTPMRGEGERYVTRATAAAPPAEITVTNVSDDPPFPFTVPLRDTVTITNATYDLDTSVLTVQATSSDGGATLTVLSGLGDELGGIGDLPMAAPPEVVTVVSDGGGSASAQVRITGNALPPRPVAADAGPDQTVPQGRRVRLDATGSAGVLEPVGFAWEEVSNTGLVLDGADTATPSFEAPAAGTSVTLRLTVTRTDGGSTATDEVTIAVEPLTPPVAALGADRVVPVGDQVALDGSGSAGAATFAWSAGPGGPDLSGEDGPSVTFPMPGTPVEVTLTVDGAGGAPDSATVTLTPEPDQLLTDRPEFRTRRGQWRISGTSSATPPNRVTAWLLGRNPGDPRAEIGQATVDRAGAFDIRTLVAPDDLALRPGTGALVELTSTRGGRFVDEVDIRD